MSTQAGGLYAGITVRQLQRNIIDIWVYVLKWGVVASLVGVGGGLGALLLRRGISAVAEATVQLPLWITPALGAALASLVFLWDRNASGFGTDRYITAVNLHYGHLERKTAISKLLATVATLGFRGSGGIEGPMVLIGGSIANTMDRLPAVRRFFSVHDRRILTICGAAGALGAAFHSPLAGGIFAVEVLYKASLHYSDLFPAMLSSTMGFVVYSALDNAEPLLRIPEYLPNPANTHLFVLAAIAGGVGAVLFMRVFQFCRFLAGKVPYSRLAPVLGGLAAGVVIAMVPQSAGVGLDVIQDLIFSAQPLGVLLLMIMAKMVATSLTIGFGGSGGVVIPALFVGAACGNAVGGFVAVGQEGLLASLVVAGMSAGLSSVASVPMSAAILSVEMVGLRLAVPATIGSVIGYIIGKNHVIYSIAVSSEPAFTRAYSIRTSDRTLEE